MRDFIYNAFKSLNEIKEEEKKERKKLDEDYSPKSHYTLYEIHSDEDEQNMFTQFDDEDEAIKYCEEYGDESCWVDKTTYRRDTDEIVDSETIWVYSEDCCDDEDEDLDEILSNQICYSKGYYKKYNHLFDYFDNLMIKLYKYFDKADVDKYLDQHEDHLAVESKFLHLVSTKLLGKEIETEKDFDEALKAFTDLLKTLGYTVLRTRWTHRGSVRQGYITPYVYIYLDTQTEKEDLTESKSLNEAKIHYYYAVYSLDEDGDEVDQLKDFKDFDKAVDFAQKQNFPTHICYVPDQDPDNYGMENEGDYEDFEVVWTSEAGYLVDKPQPKPQPIKPYTTDKIKIGDIEVKVGDYIMQVKIGIGGTIRIINSLSPISELEVSKGVYYPADEEHCICKYYPNDSRILIVYKTRDNKKSGPYTEKRNYWWTKDDLTPDIKKISNNIYSRDNKEYFILSDSLITEIPSIIVDSINKEIKETKNNWVNFITKYPDSADDNLYNGPDNILEIITSDDLIGKKSPKKKDNKSIDESKSLNESEYNLSHNHLLYVLDNILNWDRGWDINRNNVKDIARACERYDDNYSSWEYEKLIKKYSLNNLKKELNELTESKKKKNNITYVGNPDAEVNFFNKAMGNVPTATATADGGIGAVSISESKIEEKTLSQKMLDKLGEGLEEALPPDIARAYKKLALPANKTSKDVKETGIGKINTRRGTLIDFENSNYEKIDKEEALRLFKEDKSNLAKMVFLFRDYNNRVTGLVLYNEDGVQINHAKPYTSYIDRNGNEKEDTRDWPAKGVIDLASDIYLTDENEHKIDTTSIKNKDYDELETPLYNYWSSNKYSDLSDKIDLNLNPRSISDDPITSKRLTQAYTTADTGKHDKTVNYTLKWYQDYLKKYKKLKNELNNPNLSEKEREDLEVKVNSAKTCMQEYFNDYMEMREENRMNSKDAKYISYLHQLNLLKYKKYKKELDNFKEKIEDARSDRYINKYTIQASDIKRLEKELDEHQREIQKIQDKIASIRAEMKEEDKYEAEKIIQNKLNDLAVDYFDLENRFNKLLGRETENPEETEGEEMKESLQESICYKLYMEDLAGKEDIIDLDCATQDECVDKAVEILKSEDNQYSRAVLIELDADKDIDDVEANIVWDSDTVEIEEEKDEEEVVESLTESKKFDVRNDNDVLSAIAYKNVDKDKPEELIAIDPNIESEDQENRAQVGDALLECNHCYSIITMKVANLEKDEGSDVYNKDFACPHCGSKDGYNYIAQLASPEVEDRDEEIENPTEEVDTEATETDVDMDIDEVQEESFDRLVNNYTKKLYENIKSYKTTNIVEGENELTIKGILESVDGKKVETSFVFQPKLINEKLILEGYNKSFTGDLNTSFRVDCKVENKQIVCESLYYKYNKKDQLVEGLIK